MVVSADAYFDSNVARAGFLIPGCGAVQYTARMIRTIFFETQASPVTWRLVVNEAESFCLRHLDSRIGIPLLENTALNTDECASGGTIACSGGQVTLLGIYLFTMILQTTPGRPTRVVRSALY